MIVDLTGQKFGLLTALKRERRNGTTYWTCRCECGHVKEYTHGNLRAGLTTRCPDCRSKAIGSLIAKHGRSKDKIYTIWRTTKEHGRIKRWDKFENFLEDMGEIPEDRPFLNRKNTNKPHSLNNSFWGEKYQSHAKTYACCGEEGDLQYWAKRLGVSRQRLDQLLRGHENIEAYGSIENLIKHRAEIRGITMAQVIDDFPNKGRPSSGKPQKYPWDDYMDGQLWILEKGVDFDCDTSAFMGAAHAHAKMENLTVNVRNIDEYVFFRFKKKKRKKQSE